MIEMLRVTALLARSLDLVKMGCDLRCVHTAADVRNQRESPCQQLEYLRKHIDPRHLAIAGGINQENLDAVLLLAPAVVVVEGAITRAVDPAASAKLLGARIDNYAGNHGSDRP
jgi:3-keto-L-gulonate-6-phosphate decarboxylase